MNKRLVLALIAITSAAALAAGAADPAIPSALPATRPAREIPLSSLYVTSWQEGLMRVTESPFIEKGREVFPQAGLVWGKDFAEIAKLPVTPLPGGDQEKTIIARSADKEAQLWAVVYLGSDGSRPPQWLVDKVTVPSKNQWAVLYHHAPPGPVTQDERAYYVWIPLGQVDLGDYSLRLVQSGKVTAERIWTVSEKGNPGAGLSPRSPDSSGAGNPGAGAATQPAQADAAAINALLAQLGNADFAVREQATAKLIEIGEPARPFLQTKAKEKELDPEVATRIEAVLKQLPTTQPTGKDGLAVTIQPIRTTFKPGEALEFQVVYRNVSKETFRLPDQPGLYNYWRVMLEDKATGKTYTGKTLLPIGGRTNARPTDDLAPGKTFELKIALQRYGYSEGDWVRATAKALPVGKYKLSIEIRFPETPPPDGKPAPIWAGGSITSNSVEIEVAE